MAPVSAFARTRSCERLNSLRATDQPSLMELAWTIDAILKLAKLVSVIFLNTLIVIFHINFWRDVMKQKILIASLLATMGISTSAMAGNLLETMSDDGGFKTLLSAIKTAGMEDTFKAAGPMTLFAPTDLAFTNIPKAKLDALLADKAALKKLITYFVVPSKISKEDVDAGKVKTLEGEDLSLSIKEGVKVNNVSVIGQGINADNGVIHAVNTVLMPKS